MPEIPFGQKESATLEFMGRETLEDLFLIGREVVAFLNAGGGEVWVGLREEQGRAVLVEGIEKPELERQRMLEYLVDSIEPRLTAAEVAFAEVVDEVGQVVLQLRVSPRESSRPYALLKQTGRHFLKRFADRVVTMSREEIRAAFAERGGERAALDLLGEALEERSAAANEHRHRLWMRIAFGEALSLDVQASEINEALWEPRVTGNRSIGWNYVEIEHAPEQVEGAIRTRGNPLRQLTLFETGKIVYWADLRMLTRSREGRELIGPLALLEIPVSVLRLARYVSRHAEGADDVVVDFALFEVGTLGLVPGSPLEPSTYRSWRPNTVRDGPDLLLDQPILASVEELRDGDRVGFRLVRKVYQAFGFAEKDIPSEFDRKSGRLVIPE